MDRQEKPFLRQYATHSKQSIPLKCHTIQLKLFPLASRSTFFLFANGQRAPTSAWQSTTVPRKRDMWRSYSSQGKQGHKLPIEEAISSWSDTATHFIQSNSRKGLQPWSYRLLTRLAALLTQASSALPNWSGRFSAARSKPQEPSDVVQ